MLEKCMGNVGDSFQNSGDEKAVTILDYVEI